MLGILISTKFGDIILVLILAFPKIPFVVIYCHDNSYNYGMSKKLILPSKVQTQPKEEERETERGWGLEMKYL